MEELMRKQQKEVPQIVRNCDSAVTTIHVIFLFTQSILTPRTCVTTGVKTAQKVIQENRSLWAKGSNYGCNKRKVHEHSRSNFYVQQMFLFITLFFRAVISITMSRRFSEEVELNPKIERIYVKRTCPRRTICKERNLSLHRNYSRTWTFNDLTISL